MTCNRSEKNCIKPACGHDGCRHDTSQGDARLLHFLAQRDRVSGPPAEIPLNAGGRLLVTPFWWLMERPGPLLLCAPHGNIAATDWPVSPAVQRPAGDLFTWQIAAGLGDQLQTSALRGCLPRYLADCNRHPDSYEQPPGGKRAALAYQLALCAAVESWPTRRVVIDIHGYAGKRDYDAVIAWQDAGPLANRIAAGLESGGCRVLLQGRDQLPEGLRGNHTLRQLSPAGGVQLELSLRLREQTEFCINLLAGACRP